MSKHTRARWYAAQPENCGGWWIVATDPEGKNCVDESGDGGFTEETARLIAAAPEMLEALENVEAWLMDGITEKDVESEVWHPNFRKALLATRAAIAKARGE